MKKIKDFISKHRLKHTQKKEDAVLDLIVYYALCLRPFPIIDNPLLFSGYYDFGTIEAVAKCLSYKCDIEYSTDKSFTLVTFHEK